MSPLVERKPLGRSQGVTLESRRTLSAAGLAKAGLPTDPKAPGALAKILSADLAKVPPQSDEFGLTMRTIGALSKVGTAKQVPLLEMIGGDATLKPILRQNAKRAVTQIRRRDETAR